MSLSLITDRSSADLSEFNDLRLKIKNRTATGSEWDTWNSIWKATYNYTDLNRVESAVSELQTSLNNVGFNLNLSIKTDWAVGDHPQYTDIERYRTNVAAIRAALAVYSTTPAVPSNMDKLTFTSANNIEKILLDVEQLIYNLSHTVNLGWALGIADIGLYGGIA